MKFCRMAMIVVLAGSGLAVVASAGSGPKQGPKAASAGATTAQPSASDDDLRLEGEKRFRTNCGRCHQPPHKFPPRMMATIIRHMRVRSMITEEDMKLILRYMTQ